MKLTRTRGAVAGVLLVLSLMLAVAGSAGAGGLHFSHCGTVKGQGARFSILAHKVRCPVARRVIRAVVAEKGRRRRDPATGQIDRVIDGWICGTAAGGFSCAKQGSPWNGPSINAVAR